MKYSEVIILLVFVVTTTVGGKINSVDDNTKEDRAVSGGPCGPNLQWSINFGTSTLTISGTGEMYDYSVNYGYIPNDDYHGKKSNIRNVIFTDGVTAVGASAFSGFSLTSVTFSSTIVTIGDNAFSNAGLTSISIPSSVTTIGSSAFENCGLSTITFESPSSLSTINDSAFANTPVAAISIPSSVTTIGSFAFYGCSNLASLSYLGTSAPSCSSGVFKNTKWLKFACVPVDYNSDTLCNSLRVYKSESSCDEVYSQENKCFKAEMDDEGFIILTPRYLTKVCYEYQCDNNTGVTYSWSTCNSTEETKRVCLNNTCVEETIPKPNDTSVAIEVNISEGYDATDLNTDEIQGKLGSMANSQALSVASETNNSGKVLRIVILVNDQTTANNVLNIISNTQDDKYCELNALCNKANARIVTYEPATIDPSTTDSNTTDSNTTDTNTTDANTTDTNTTDSSNTNINRTDVNNTDINVYSLFLSVGTHIYSVHFWVLLSISLMFITEPFVGL